MSVGAADQDLFRLGPRLFIDDLQARMHSAGRHISIERALGVRMAAAVLQDEVAVAKREARAWLAETKLTAGDVPVEELMLARLAAPVTVDEWTSWCGGSLVPDVLPCRVRRPQLPVRTGAAPADPRRICRRCGITVPANVPFGEHARVCAKNARGVGSPKGPTQK